MGFYSMANLLLAWVRMAVFAVVVVAALVLLLDWLVRSRRISPFHPLARMMRRVVDPLLVPVERRIVRAGGLPSAAPLWALVGVAFAGIVLVSVLGFLVRSSAEVMFALASGPRGVFVLLVQLTFSLLRLALIVVVVTSWLPISPYAGWVRWAFSLTNPILQPLRQVVPRIGMLDITPIVAYFALGILEWAFLQL
ncbi:MAG TPA: YggT family protein [Candidatus Elarobacter sp.]|nr:YggT family protein [Candidatus Elarobacter sp.]